MTVAIPDDIALEAGIDEHSALIELAFALYARERISAAQLREMCGIGFFEFEKLAGERELPTGELTEEALRQDLHTLDRLGFS